jgi:hypothetical protein
MKLGCTQKTKEQIASEAVAQAKVCPNCGKLKGFEEFGKCAKAVHGLAYDCRPCQAVYSAARRKSHYEQIHKASQNSVANRIAADPLFVRRRTLKYHYGLTLEQFEAMFLAQDERCAICHTANPHRRSGVWTVDHDHKTGKVRGVLCSHCNSALGFMRDKPGSLTAAVEYLRHHGEERP